MIWVLKPWYVGCLGALFVWEFMLSASNVLKAIYFYPSDIDSGFAEIPMTAHSLTQQLIIAHFITLTPGTLSIDILPDNKILVHFLSMKNQKATERLVREKLQPLLDKIWSEGETKEC